MEIRGELGAGSELPGGNRFLSGRKPGNSLPALMRLEDAQNAEINPLDPRVEVEDVMAITLKKNHIELPDSIFTVAKDFKPKFPLKKMS